jgi:hypothetical protein
LTSNSPSSNGKKGLDGESDSGNGSGDGPAVGAGRSVTASMVNKVKPSSVSNVDEDDLRKQQITEDLVDQHKGGETGSQAMAEGAVDGPTSAAQPDVPSKHQEPRHPEDQAGDPSANDNTAGEGASNSRELGDTNVCSSSDGSGPTVVAPPSGETNGEGGDGREAKARREEVDYVGVDQRSPYTQFKDAIKWLVEFTFCGISLLQSPTLTTQALARTGVDRPGIGEWWSAYEYAAAASAKPVLRRYNATTFPPSAASLEHHMTCDLSKRASISFN